MANQEEMSLSAKVGAVVMVAYAVALVATLAACDSGGPGHKLPALDVLWVGIVGTVRRPFRVQAIPEAG